MNFFSLVLSNFCFGMGWVISSAENRQRVEGNITATESFDFIPPPPQKLPVSKWADKRSSCLVDS